MNKNNSYVLWDNTIYKNLFCNLRENVYLKNNIIQNNILKILNSNKNSKQKAKEFVKKFYRKIIKKDNKHYCNKILENKNKRYGCSKIKALGKKGKMGIPYIFSCEVIDGENLSLIIKNTPFVKTIIGIASIVGQKKIIHSNDCINKKTIGGLSKKYEILPYPGNIKNIKNNICSCNLVTDAEEFIFLDAFGQQSVIGSIINEILWIDKKYGRCGNSTYFFDSFYCTNKNNILNGWNLMSKCDAGELTEILLFEYDKKYIKNKEGNKNKFDKNDDKELEKLTDIDIITLLAQLFFALNILQKNYEFIHGDLKGKNVFIRLPTETEKKHGIEYKNIKYEDKKVNFTIKNMKYVICIADFDKSAITYNKIRFFNFPVKKIIRDTFSLEGIIKNIVKTRGKYIISDYKNKKYYKLPDVPLKYKYYKSEFIFSLLRFTGVKYFDSLDLYVFLSSLMYHNKFYRMTQKKDYKLLHKLIKTFFMDKNDLAIFYSFFKKIPRNLKNDNVESLGVTLKPYYNIKLSCNLMDNIINFFVNYNKNMKSNIILLP